MANLQMHGLWRSKRNITKIFLHCSATPEMRKHDVEDIRLWHKNKGWKDVGYHYVVTLDGTVQEGRSVNLDGAHAKGHNQDSIAVCYIGGLTKSGKTPKDTRTEPQVYALHNLLTDLKKLYPKATIHGHNEFSSKACPSFDVQSEYYYLNNNTVKSEIMTEEQDIQDFELEGDFADFVNDLTEDKANENAVCGIDSSECDSCGA